MGLVRPRTVRPVSGVWESSCSRPVPPVPREGARRLAVFRAVLTAFERAAVRDRREAETFFARREAFGAVFLPFWDGFGTFLRFPLGGAGLAVFRRARLLRVAARAAVFRPGDVRFRPLLFAVFFLAMALID